MSPPSPSRAALALLVAGGAVALGAMIGSAAIAAALGVGGGAVALIVLTWRAPVEAPRAAALAPPPGPGLDALIDALDDPVLVVEAGRVLRANRAAEALLGEHIVGQDARVAIRHPAAVEALAGPLGDGGVETELTGVGGRDRPWELTAHPLGGDSRLIRLADRSANRAAEKMRVDFVANASHELRTPLAALLGFIETLSDADGPEDAATRARFLGIMGGEARRMQRLIEDLMSLSRIEAERHSAPRDAVDLAPLIDEVAATFGNAEVIVAVDGAPPVAGDRSQLSQLLHNLIGNAAKYGRAGEPVTVALDATDEMVRLRVIDRGEGIAAVHLPRLTERFYRADASRSRTLGGTGLGLAIVKHIVERHRGRLTIDSVVGTGTTVTVLLPPAHDAGTSR